MMKKKIKKLDVTQKKIIISLSTQERPLITRNKNKKKTFYNRWGLLELVSGSMRERENMKH